MPQGIEIYDGNGSLTFTSADSLARICGSVYVTGGQNGSISVDLSGGRPYAFFQQNDNFDSVPAITTTTTSVSWTWPPNMSQGGTLFYGYY